MRGIGDALAFADAKLRGNKPLVMEAKELGNGKGGGCKQIWKQKNDLWVEVCVDDPMIYIYIIIDILYD